MKIPWTQYVSIDDYEGFNIPDKCGRECWQFILICTWIQHLKVDLLEHLISLAGSADKCSEFSKQRGIKFSNTSLGANALSSGREINDISTSCNICLCSSAVQKPYSTFKFSVKVSFRGHGIWSCCGSHFKSSKLESSHREKLPVLYGTANCP